MNPVSKARIIVDRMTKDVYIANKLLSVITRELTVEEINKLFNEIIITNNQLKLSL